MLNFDSYHNLHVFWITPDGTGTFINNKNSGGLKVYDTPAPENWTISTIADTK